MSLRLNQILGGADIRSPIFYDSNDTTYYVDPNSLSNIRHTIFHIGSNLVGATGVGVLFDGNYTTGQYRHRFRKYDDGGGLPLYIDYAHGTANSFTTIARFGGGGSYNPFSVYGTADASGDFRAPIFYDSNNTAFYIDAASTSVINILQFAANTAQIIGNTSSSYGSLDVRGVRNGWRGIHFNAGGNTPHLMFDGSANGGVYFETGGRWASYYSYGNNCWGFGTSTTNSAYNLYLGTGIYSGGRVDGTIFYDSNDSTYYVDPASFSLISSMGIGGLTSSNNVQMYDSYVDASSSYLQSPPLIIRKDNSATGAIDQAPVGLFIYNLNGTNNTWTKLSMGSREAAGAGNTVSIAGLAAQKTAGTANAWATGNLHFWTKAGATQITNMVAYSTGYVQSDYSFRSPIFYDSNNTAYYIDAASTSNLNNLTVAGTMTFGTLAYVTESRRSKNSSNVDIETVTGLVSPSGPTFLEIRGFCPPTMYRTTGDRPAPYGLGFGNGSESGGIMPIGAGDNLQEIMLYGANSGPTTFTFKRQIWEGNAQDPSFSNYYGSSVFSINTGTGAVTASTDIRSPIYYDQNNTSYYSDPAGLNRFNALNIGNQGALTGNTTYALGAYHNSRYMVGLRYSSGGAAYPWLVHDSWNGSAFIIHFNSVGDRFHVSESGIAYVTGDFRAPIFYDSNNTSYYIDPASTSNLVGLTVANTITGSISGNAATATNSTQLGGVAAANYVRNDVDGTDSTALFRLTTITKSLTITTSWLDTGIVGANLATGCYMISVYVDNYAVSGGHYQETYTGMMSWFSTGTNSTDYDEIVLHKSGHASNGAYINLRTIRQLSGGTNLKLQIISSVSTSGASNYVFKFRRLI